MPRIIRERTLGDAREYETIVESGAKLPRPELVPGQQAPSANQELAQDITKELANACITTSEVPYVVPPMLHRPRLVRQMFTIAAGLTSVRPNLLVIPQDCQGAFTGFGHGMAPSAGGLPPAGMWAEGQWTITLNAVPVSPDYDRWAGQISTLLPPLHPLYIFLRPGDAIGMVLTNNNIGVVSYDMSIVLTGWDYVEVNKFDRDKCFTKKPRA